MNVLPRVCAWARAFKRELGTLALAARHPRTPWYARAVAIAVVAYAVSPIDLIPDFIPVLGLLDDAILLPLGIVLFRRLTPRDVIAECRARAADAALNQRSGRGAAVVVVFVWIVLAAIVLSWLRRVT